MPYLVAGYPSPRLVRERLWQAHEAGASLIELGIPFSDPVADGPTIQAAVHASLRGGTTPRKCLEFVRGLRREGFPLPILGMTYANVLEAPGLDAAARSWAAAGIDGAIVPDVPHEESAPWRTAFHREGLGTVSFASPGTSEERLRAILGGLDSFVYLVAVYGTTGSRAQLAPETRMILRRAVAARKKGGPPICVGFGISRQQHVAELRRLGADGAIVGSALLERIHDGARTRRFLAELARGAHFQELRH